MNKLIILRIIADIIIFVAVISGWWHIALLVSFISMTMLPYFIEIIIFGIIFDSLFGYNQSLGILGYVGTVSSLIIFSVVYFLQNTLRR